MSIDRSAENKSDWNDSKSADLSKEKKDPWEERKEIEKKNRSVPNGSEEQKRADSKNIDYKENISEDVKKERNLEQPNSSSREARNPSSYEENRSFVSKEEIKSKSESGKETLGAYEGGSKKSHNSERNWEIDEERWGEGGGKNEKEENLRGWNEERTSGGDLGERKRRDFQDFNKPRNGEIPETWPGRRSNKRLHDGKEGSYEETRKYEMLDYPPRKKRGDESAYFSQPGRFRDGMRGGARGGEIPRRPDWPGRESGACKDGWNEPRGGYGGREGFETRGNWGRHRSEAYNGARTPSDGWSRARQEGYGGFAGRERRGDFGAPPSWNYQPMRGDFGGSRSYGSGDGGFKNYRYVSNRTRYTYEGGFPPDFRGRRDVPVNPPPSKVIGLFGLSNYASLDDVKEFLREKIPDVRYKDVHLVKDRYTGQSRGFGFIYFSSLDEAITAKEQLQGKNIYGKAIRVDYSVSEGPRTVNNDN